MFHESDTDFDQSWYNGNGLAITKAMVINAFINPIVEIGMGCVRKLLRWYDTMGDEDTKTKK